MSQNLAAEKFIRMSRASLPNPFQVAFPWSVSPPNLHRFTARANRGSLRFTRPLSDTQNSTVRGDRSSARWPVDSSAAATCTSASPASVAPQPRPSQQGSRDLRGRPKRNFQVFSGLDFLAEVTQHLRDPQSLKNRPSFSGIAPAPEIRDPIFMYVMSVL